MILQKNAISSISKMLGLSFTGLEQDWDLEMANPSRFNEFISCYEKLCFTNAEKLALMSIILSSYEELEEEEQILHWHNLEKMLLEEKKLFQSLIDYWSAWNKDKTRWKSLSK